MRERQGLSSRALAERVGCSSSYVSKLETQGMVPAANVFARLVNVLECSDADYFQRKETFSFHLCTSWNCPGALTYGNRYSQLIDLDEEDIKYFEDKYLSKLDKEMEDKINKIKKEYGKVD